MKKYLTILLVIIIQNLGFSQKIINVDFNTNLGTIKDLSGVNCGPGNALNTYKDAGVSIIRTHDYYGPTDYDNYTTFYNKSTSSFNTSFDPDNTSHYIWGPSDNKIDSIIKSGFQAYFRLGVSWPNETTPVIPPTDPDGTNFTKFARLCKRTVMHYNNEWNNGFKYNIRYWEIWNEPDGKFFKGPAVQFYKMFETVSDTLRALDPTLKIGGPGALCATILTKSKPYLSDFLTYCKSNNVKLDFYAWHMYGQNNPYSTKEFGEFVRAQLDSIGLQTTESYLDEINIGDGEISIPVMKSAKGAAYVASMLMAAQEGSVDKVFFYRGDGFMNLFNADLGIKPNYNWSGFGFKAFNLFAKYTPTKIKADGSECITGSNQVDTTNLMVLAGKSTDQKSVYILISNYNSSKNSFTININNLLWNSSGNVTFRKNIVKEPTDKFTETTSSITGSKNITLNLQDLPSPSIAMIRLDFNGKLTKLDDLSDLNINSFSLSQNYPNPFNPVTNIKFTVPKNDYVILRVYDVLGREVGTLVNEIMNAGTHSVVFDSKGLSGGTYFYRLNIANKISQKSMILIK